jgi:hypothetical protein
MAEIDRTVRLQPARPGYRRVRTLSAAVRVFVLQTLTAPPSSGKALARDCLDRRGRYPEGCVQARRSGSRPHPERSRKIFIAAPLRGILLPKSPFPLLARRIFFQ